MFIFKKKNLMAGGVCKEEIYKKTYFEHCEYLRNFLFYKSGNMGLSEDLVQEAFVKLWENCAKVSIEKAKSYLFTVANNLFLNSVSHQKVKLKFENFADANKFENDPQFILEEKEFKLKLESAIAELPETQRIVFLMNRIDKKKYREIAEELDLSVKAVEKRMHLALAALRKVHKKV